MTPACQATRSLGLRWPFPGPARVRGLHMITLRQANERGRADFGWLDSRHTFSFGNYHDPHHMGVGPLRVINEDRVQPGQGFNTHGHSDMEIISYVLEGALEHKDSLGTGSVIRPGDVQRMSAGTGIRHSEFNASKTELVHFLQIWLIPDRQGLAPSYEQKHFTDADRRGRLRLVASPDGRYGSVTVHLDTMLYVSLLDRGAMLEHVLAPGRLAWLQVARGRVDLNDTALQTGDGASVRGEQTLTLAAVADGTEVLFFDLPR